MKITHICEADSGGGAMLAAKKLHTALLSLGHESNVLVRIKNGKDTRFVSIRENLSAMDWLSYKVRRFKNKRIQRRYQPYPSDQVGPFSTGIGNLGSALARQIPESDIFALHWSAELIDFLPLMKAIGDRPAFWRMADMNPMTGGCHYSMGCERFTQRCGFCPMLTHSGPEDLSHLALTRKLRAFSGIDPKRFNPVAPSHWLKQKAERSALFKRFETIHIPTGVNTQNYKPIPQNIARQQLGLSDTEKVLLFAADTVDDHRKGFDLLLAALQRLPENLRVTPVAMGKVKDRRNGIHYLGKIDGAAALSAVYSAADAFVLPTRADNLPNVALEAMACKLPVISFDVGGMPDCIVEGETGFLAPPEDTTSLAQFIERVLTDDGLRHAMSKKCRALMLNEFSEDISARRYEALCKRLIG